MADADHHIPAIVGEIVDAIGNSFADRLAGKNMVVHIQRLTPPGPTSILEASNQLFLFRIDANNRVASLEKGSPLLINVAKLTIAIRIVCAGDRLAIAVQGIVALPQQPGNRGPSDAEAFGP